MESASKPNSEPSYSGSCSSGKTPAFDLHASLCLCAFVPMSLTPLPMSSGTRSVCFFSWKDNSRRMSILVKIM